MNLRIKVIRRVPEPKYQTTGAAAFDLHAAVMHEVTIKPFERVKIPTGLVMAIPAGYEGQVRPRSGLASNEGLTVVNSPGTIDSDFRGEVCVTLINLDAKRTVTIHPSDRIAQMAICPVIKVDFEIADELDDTERGHGGHGSTGRH